MRTADRRAAARSRARPGLVLGALGLLMAAGCGSATRTDPRLHLASTTDPGTLDPAFAKDVAGGRLVGLLYATLVRFDRQMTLVGDLADRWTVSPDGLRYTFHIRSNARFASGRKITPEDVRGSFERVLAPATGSPRTWVLDRIRGAGAHTKGETDRIAGIVVAGEDVSLLLDRPFAPFLGLLTMPAASIVDLEAVGKYGARFHEHPTGSGAFVLKSWSRDASLELVPSPTYHLPGSSLPGVVVRVLKEPLTVVSEFELGNLDVIQVPSQSFASLWSDPRWKDHHLGQPGLNVYYVGLNCESGPFTDPRVRRAAAHAIDRVRLIGTVRKDQAVEARGPIPPGLEGHDPAFTGLSYDPDRARALLAEAGFAGGGPAIRLLQGEARANLEVTQLVKAFLERAGFQVTLQSSEWNIFRSRVDLGEFDAFYLSWFADYADAENFLYPLFHSSKVGGSGNAPRYRSPEVDRLLEEALATVDPAARVVLYRRIQERVVQDSSRIFLFHLKELWVRQPWVRGFELHPVFNGNRLEGVSIDPSGFPGNR